MVATCSGGMTAASKPGSPPSTSPITAAISAVAPCLVAAVTRTFIAPSSRLLVQRNLLQGGTGPEAWNAAASGVAGIVAQQGDQQSEHRDAPEPEPPAEQHQAKARVGRDQGPDRRDR